jgi:hypothetical protein
LPLCLAGAVLVLAGCGTVALRHSFNDYSEVYAETQNRQMLLNLARLRERQPIYFFQLAQISAGYTFTETASLADSKSIGLPNSTTANVRTAGTATHNPIFTFIPLAGDKFANQLLSPIKPEIFNALYEEGWPVDELMRILIERIELDLPEGLEILVNNPRAGTAGHYERFLRACGLAREFQDAGLLYLDVSDEFQPIAPVTFDKPDLKDVLEAAKSGLVWRMAVPPATAGWQLGKMAKRTIFRLDNGHRTGPFMDELARQHPYERGDDRPIERFRGVLNTGFGVTDTSTNHNTYKVRLVMRSLLGVMAAVAADQEGYEWVIHDPAFDPDMIPPSEARPTLQLTWPEKPATRPLIWLDYAGTHYVVADPPGAPGQPPGTWNRDIFRLLVQLSFQVTADPTSFAAPSLIQLR